MNVSDASNVWFLTTTGGGASESFDYGEPHLTSFRLTVVLSGL